MNLAKKLEQVVFDHNTRALLYAAGQQDKANGVHRYQGWVKVCEQLDWQDEGRTPAREAYEDGYYA